MQDYQDIRYSSNDMLNYTHMLNCTHIQVHVLFYGIQGKMLSFITWNMDNHNSHFEDNRETGN